MTDMYPIFDQHTQRLYQAYDPNDDDTQELPAVDLRAWEIEQIKRDMHNIAMKQARQDMQMAALKRRLDDLEGDGR